MEKQDESEREYDEEVGKYTDENWSISERLGTFCNTPEEIHTLVDGIYMGFIEWRLRGTPTLPKKERAYFQGGFILGVICKVLLILLIGKYIWTVL